MITRDQLRAELGPIGRMMDDEEADHYLKETKRAMEVIRMNPFTDTISVCYVYIGNVWKVRILPCDWKGFE